MFIDPAAVLARCNIQSTDSVADFGAGSGFVARAAAALVPHGNVFAIEIHRDTAHRLTREVHDAHIKNLQVLWGDIEVAGGTKLADASIDVVIISNVLFHLDDKEGALREAHRILKDAGRMLVVEWKDSFGGLGPHPQSVVSKDSVQSLAARVGFEKLVDTLPAGDHHYAILFKKIGRH